jgi:hypothetical protein
VHGRRLWLLVERAFLFVMCCLDDAMLAPMCADPDGGFVGIA